MPIRVVIAKVGLDGHDRGAHVIVRALRDAGMEIVYTGIRQTPEMVVAAVEQEDAPFLGISSLSGSHLHHIPRVIELLKEKKLDTIVFAGGIIPAADVAALEKLGVKRVFSPGTTTTEVVEFINGLAAART